MDVRVQVIPKSAKTEMAGTMEDGTLRVRVAAAPEKGRANEELCRFLAEHFGVAKSAVRVVAGETSRRKRVRIG